MKILIVYASKTGTTEQCATMIKAASKDNQIDLCDVKKVKKSNLAA
ncbi:MAG TPA: hypothetical protein DCS67_10470 [Clostridiales bacterium UBA8960]|jgi:flavodoxin|nr:hypothetical protein [Clostridiales bacterium UBA8960]